MTEVWIVSLGMTEDSSEPYGVFDSEIEAVNCSKELGESCGAWEYVEITKLILNSKDKIRERIQSLSN